MALSKYNKGRPFLIVSHSAVPKNKKLGQKNQWDINENIVIVDKIIDNHLYSSSVILDILKQKIIKNRFTDNHTEKEVVEYYMTKYNDEILRGIDIWLKKQTIDVAATAQLISDLKEELAIGE